jgi:hypothetical protein
MRCVRFIHGNPDGRFAWQTLCYFRPAPKPPCVDVEDFRMESARDFVTVAEAKADQERVESQIREVPSLEAQEISAPCGSEFSKTLPSLERVKKKEKD